MRRYLILTLIASLAGVVWATGCTTADKGALSRSMYVDEHPELTELMAEAILNEQIMIGMTEEMVEVSWGKPARVESVREANLTERWIYGNYFVGGTITSLYFDEHGTLNRYEVDNEQTHVNNGAVSEPGSETALSRAGAGTLIQKGTGTP